jgi:hypothetical protein
MSPNGFNIPYGKDRVGHIKIVSREVMNLSRDNPTQFFLDILIFIMADHMAGLV